MVHMPTSLPLSLHPKSNITLIVNFAPANLSSTSEFKFLRAEVQRHGGHQLRRPLPSTSSDRNDENEDSLATNDLRHKLKHRNNAGGGNQRHANIESGLQKLSLGECKEDC